MSLTLGVGETHVVKWWIDVEFAVTNDIRSESEPIVTLQNCAIYSASLRERVNTCSSTEVEIVGVDSSMPQILWTRYFLEE